MSAQARPRPPARPDRAPRVQTVAWAAAAAVVLHLCGGWALWRERATPVVKETDPLHVRVTAVDTARQAARQSARAPAPPAAQPAPTGAVTPNAPGTASAKLAGGAKTAAALPPPPPPPYTAPNPAAIPVPVPVPVATTSPTLAPSPTPTGTSPGAASPTPANAVPSPPLSGATPQQAPPTSPALAPAADAARSDRQASGGSGQGTDPIELDSSAVAYLVQPVLTFPDGEDLGEYGTVTLRVLIDERGKAIEVRTLKSSGYPRLDQHGARVIRRATFKPQKVQGESRKAWAAVNLHFNPPKP